jgi:hypothetical protein
MPNIGDIKFTDIKVNCMREPYLDRAMQMKFMFLDNGTWFPAPCNGCDFLDGHDSCNRCMSILTSMFFHNPDLDTSKPITPVEYSED